MHRLVGMRTYLCGPMDRVPDGGRVWRDQITPLLHQRGVIVFDPARKPIRSAQDETSKEERIAWMNAGRYDLITEFMKEVRGQDLRMVNISDFLVTRVDPDVHMCGSYEEIAIANSEKKPILIWTVGGKDRTPWWLLGQVPHEHVFGSMEELLEYLDYVDVSPNVNTYKRWFFFEQDQVYHPAMLEKLAGVLNE